VAFLREWCRATGRLISPDRAQPGDILGFAGDHIGIVERVARNNGTVTFDTVEGNTNNEQARRRHQLKPGYHWVARIA
jgi:hypothetical protein